MPKIIFKDGTIVNFSNTPTTKDIQDAASKLKLDPTDAKELTTGKKIGQVLVGAGKGILSTIKGTSELGEKTLGRLVGAYKGGETSAETIIPKKLTEAQNKLQQAGKTAEQIAEFAIPATKLAKAEKGLSLTQKLASRALTSGGIASAQEGKIGSGTAIAVAAEILLPGASKIAKPVKKLGTRLLSSLGSGVSGLSAKSLKTIAENPKTGIEATKEITQKGVDKGVSDILTKNAKTIVNGVSKIRQEARKEYGKAVEKLKSSDIYPSAIYDNVIEPIKKAGINITNKGISFVNSEIFDKNIQNRTKKIINEIDSLSEADGKQIKTMINRLESFKFKSTGGEPNRLAFNTLMTDIQKGFRNIIGNSGLESANKKYTDAMDLAGRIQRIFGKVKFKNGEEIARVASKLENLDNLKIYDEGTLSEFLKKIGVDKEKFMTSEAIRSSYTKEFASNPPGTSWSELLRGITTTMITPVAVKNLAIATGLTEKAINEIVKRVEPTGRAAIIKALMEK